jgi:hypothetical protein
MADETKTVKKKQKLHENSHTSVGKRNRNGEEKNKTSQKTVSLSLP